jgi:hypothetical protein
MDRSASVLGMMLGALFLGCSDSVQLCWVSIKGCYTSLREIHIVEGHTWTEHGIRMACGSDFLCRVYINSNHRDSQI